MARGFESPVLQTVVGRAGERSEPSTPDVPRREPFRASILITSVFYYNSLVRIDGASRNFPAGVDSDGFPLVPPWHPCFGRSLRSTHACHGHLFFEVEMKVLLVVSSLFRRLSAILPWPRRRLFIPASTLLAERPWARAISVQASNPLFSGGGGLFYPVIEISDGRRLVVYSTKPLQLIGNGTEELQLALLGIEYEEYPVT
jgi:hypothetical protein